jgi:integrase
LRSVLTPLSVKNARPGAARREIADASCKGLHLVVQPSGAMSWAFRYRFAGKPRKLTIGPVYDGRDEPEAPALDQANTLAGARKLATDAALQVAKGIDPAKHKVNEKAAARLRAENSELLDRDTVEAVARLFVEKHAKANNRRRSWVETGRLIGLKPDPDDASKLVLIKPNKATPAGGEVLGRWRERSIHEITRRDVRDLLDRIIARGAPGAANHTLAAVRKLFAWAAERDIIASSPCADLKPPTKKNSRDRVLADDELQLVWRGAEAIGWPFGPMIKLLALTLQRRNEVAQMDREEIDRQQRIWLIPKERVKNAQEHEVALAPPTLEILEGLPKIGHNSGCSLVFTMTGVTAVSGFSRAKRRLDAAILKLQKDDAIASGQDPDQVKPLPPWTLHDLRRTGASGMARLGIQLPTIEKVLNHTSGSFGGVVGVYQRHSFSEEKRQALETWSQFVMATVADNRPANVISLRRQ